jgi:hypothetical protein
VCVAQKMQQPIDSALNSMVGAPGCTVPLAKKMHACMCRGVNEADLQYPSSEAQKGFFPSETVAVNRLRSEASFLYVHTAFHGSLLKWHACVQSNFMTMPSCKLALDFLTVL